jgi:predicted DNA-binding helix-hairpin-helix protein
MDALEKLKLLGPPTCFEPAEEVGAAGRRSPPPRDDLSGCVHNAVMPGGKRIALLKTLLTSACERDCRYCAFRQGRNFRRVSFSHIHLKIMPGAEREQVLAAMRLADRVSVNLEAPNSERLAHLAPRKAFAEELLQRLHWIEEIRREMPGRWPSSTTQFVVGAVDESDVELLTTTEFLHRQVGLARAYFSGFAPVPDTPLEGHPPTPPLREHRLYQSSFLLRDYGFTVEELPFDAGGYLPLGSDPKLAWARHHLAHAPVELNTADQRGLLRVPGIGPKGAEKLLHARRQGTLRDLTDLRKLGIVARRAAPFVLLDGRRQPYQLPLWPI